MKILITGVHGFVGSNLVCAMAQEHTIYGLDIIAPEKEGVVKTYSWDDLEKDAVPAVDAIIHLAGKAHDTKNQAAAEVYFKVNTGLTQKIFDYFLAHEGIKKFVFFSTAKAAADRVEDVLTEEVVPAPVGPYGESKIAAENYILSKFKEFNGLKFRDSSGVERLELIVESSSPSEAAKPSVEFRDSSGVDRLELKVESLEFRDSSEVDRLELKVESLEFRDSSGVESSEVESGSQSSKSDENLTKNPSNTKLSTDSKLYTLNSELYTDSKLSTDSELSTDSKLYTDSKLSTDSKLYTDSKRQTKSVYIFRPCMIHGPGNKGNLNLLYNVVRKGIPWPLGAFENRRTFTSVENVCFAVNGVLTRDVPSGIYNLGDDEALSTNELIEEICKSLGKKARIWKLPKGLMYGVASVGGWLHLPLDAERLRKLTENYISSNAKIKAALGVEKMPVDARTGLQVTLESFK